MCKEELAILLPSVIGRGCEIFYKAIIYTEDCVEIKYMSEANEELFSFYLENKMDAESIVNTLYDNNFHIYNSKMENLNYDNLWKELR